MHSGGEKRNKPSNLSGSVDLDTQFVPVSIVELRAGLLKELGTKGQILLNTLRAYVNHNSGLSYPGVDRMVEMSGLSRATVYRALAVLEERGRIEAIGTRYENVMYRIIDHVPIVMKGNGADSRKSLLGVAQWSLKPVNAADQQVKLINIIRSVLQDIRKYNAARRYADYATAALNEQIKNIDGLRMVVLSKSLDETVASRTVRMPGRIADAEIADGVLKATYERYAKFYAKRERAVSLPLPLDDQDQVVVERLDASGQVAEDEAADPLVVAA